MACSIHSFNLVGSAHAKEFFKILLRRKLHDFNEFSGRMVPVSAGLFAGTDTASNLRCPVRKVQLLRFLFSAKRIIHFLLPVPVRSDHEVQSVHLC